MRKLYVGICFLFMFALIFANVAKAEDPSPNTTKIDSLFRALNRKPSIVELEWIIGKIREPTNWEQAKDIVPWFTAIVAIVGFFIQRSWQLKKDRVDKLHDSLHWFEGHTQKRSLGIAMIEANWNQEKSFHVTWYAILINQAIYLLQQSESDSAAHEISNLNRIMNLLIKHKDIGKSDELKNVAKELGYQLKLKIENKGKPPGLNLTSKEHLKNIEEWQNTYID